MYMYVAPIFPVVNVQRVILCVHVHVYMCGSKALGCILKYFPDILCVGHMRKQFLLI